MSRATTKHALQQDDPSTTYFSSTYTVGIKVAPKGVV